MREKLKRLVLECVLAPFTIVAALWFRYLRRELVTFGKNNSLISERIFRRIGVFPIIDHFYEPLFNPERLRFSLRSDRRLPGIAWNIEEQLHILKGFDFNAEIIEISKRPADQLTYSFNGGSFLSGDAEYLYSTVRRCKPRMVIEVGCGQSTKMMCHALQKNRDRDGDNGGADACEHICIEPYANDWLEKLPVRVIRDLAERCDIGLFRRLQANDILFIDSSHIIRPQGDVLFEYLEVLPQLNPGVCVHVHDVFTPRDYLPEWLIDGKVFWNEQYLLEAFLSFNNSFKIIGALNYLMHHHYDDLKAACPLLTPEREPGSFWMQKTA
jgi:hypothetical protein